MSQNKCKDCGIGITKRAKRCRGCAFDNAKPFGYYKIKVAGPKAYDIAIPRKYVEKYNLLNRYYKISLIDDGRIIKFTRTEHG